MAEQRFPALKKRQSNPSATTIVKKNQNFDQTCSDISLVADGDTTLQATCRTQTGTNVQATYDLVRCM
jgi:hypothetical protein